MDGIITNESNECSEAVLRYIGFSPLECAVIKIKWYEMKDRLEQLPREGEFVSLSLDALSFQKSVDYFESGFHFDSVEDIGAGGWDGDCAQLVQYRRTRGLLHAHDGFRWLTVKSTELMDDCCAEGEQQTRRCLERISQLGLQFHSTSDDGTLIHFFTALPPAIGVAVEGITSELHKHAASGLPLATSWM